MVGSDLNLIKWYLQLWMLFQKKKKKDDTISDTCYTTLLGRHFFLYNNKEYFNSFS